MTPQIIIDKLYKRGITVNPKTGKISYLKHSIDKLECEEVYLLRHAQTFATQNNCFMSDDSENSQITDNGIAMVKNLIPTLKTYKFDTILWGPITRVRDTANIVLNNISFNSKIELPFLKGINNAGWEGKSLDGFNAIEKNQFNQREIERNIFAKSSDGNCWGEVLLNIADTIDFINEHCCNKRVLIVSQGSVLLGLEIMLRKYEVPWYNYSPQSMFNLDCKNRNQKIKYGNIVNVKGN